MLEKVTLNVGVGSGGNVKIDNAKKLLERITGVKPVATKAKKRNPSFNIRKGDLIGVKVTLRKEKAASVLKKCLEAVNFKLPLSCFDSHGNFSFGVHEYIELKGVKYDPEIGMMGFDVCVTLSKPGKRVALRRIKPARIPLKQRVSKSEAVEFVKGLGVEVLS
jgi:large subunit ribosomal protein L5